MRYQSYNNGWNYLWIGLILFIFLGGFRLIFLLLGLALALFINFFPLILIGFLIYFFSKGVRHNASINQVLSRQSGAHKRFVELFIHILCHLVHSDGRADQREIATIKTYFQTHLRFNTIQMSWVQDVIDHALKRPENLNDLCQEFKTHFEPASRLMLVDLLYQVALSDGQLHAEEDRLIQQVVLHIGISAFDHQQIRAMYVGDQDATDHHYEVLGLSPNASQEDIKKAYRAASKKHHPDTVSHLGEEFRKAAEEKMQKINAAYRALKSK